MQTRSFKQVDVFTRVRFKGNPVAVVLDGGGLSSEQMQQIANWTNLSETTFVLPASDPAADYRVRIFTPNAELPFDGHPTIGTAHALIEAGRIRPKDGALVQQCGKGLIRLDLSREPDGARWISFDLPEPKHALLGPGQREELESLLGAPVKRDSAPLVVDVGPRWVVVQLENARTVLALHPDLQCMKVQDEANGFTGVVVFGEHERGHAARIEVRAFAPAHGVDEDPVCGSGNGAVAAFLRHTGQASIEGEFLASQGAVVGRAGIIRLTVRPDRIQVGGNAVTCVDGQLDCRSGV